MAYLKTKDGGDYLDPQQFYFTTDANGKKILHVRGGGGAGGITSVNGDFGPDVVITADDIPAGQNSQQFTNEDKAKLDQTVTDINNLQTTVNNKFDKTGGTMTGDINMGGHNINGVQKIQVNGQNTIFIGSTIEAASDAPRITPTTDGKVAFVKANTQNDYVSISVGEPQSANDAATKAYVDAAVAQAGGLPAHTAADAGKALTVKADNTVAWETVGGQGGAVPSPVVGDVGHILMATAVDTTSWVDEIDGGALN